MKECKKVIRIRAVRQSVDQIYQPINAGELPAYCALMGRLARNGSKQIVVFAVCDGNSLVFLTRAGNISDSILDTPVIVTGTLP